MREAAPSVNAVRVYRQLRLRRGLFWLVLLIYLPLMLAAQKLFPGRDALVVAFVVWVGLLLASGLALAVAHCPACGRTFHMHGMSFLPVRRCLHCGVHVAQRPEESP